jgi:hypothetical protein
MSEARAALPLGVLPLVRPVRWFRPWLLGIIYALALLPMSLYPRQSAYTLSKVMTIEAFIERGTLAVERTPIWKKARPVDIVRFGPHYYSDKPPVLSVIASPIYMVMVMMDIRFTGSEIQYTIDILALTWFVVGVSSSLTLVWLRRIFQAVPISPILADLLTLGFGFGTLILTYGVTFKNHSVAAALITGAMARVLLEPIGPQASRSRFFAGYLVGLAVTIDIPVGGVMLASLGLLQSYRARSIPWSFLIGASLPLLLHAGLQSLVTGSLLPAEIDPAAFDFPGSYWTDPANVWHEHGPRWRFGIELLIGPRGWLTVTPVLAFGMVGLGLALSRKSDRFRPMAWVVASSVVVLVCYYTWGVRRTDFGGDSFGTRHLLAITPACYLFAVVALQRFKRWKLVPALFVLAMLIGSVYAVIGMKDPWKPIEEVWKTDPWLGAVQRLVIYPRSQNLEKDERPR